MEKKSHQGIDLNILNLMEDEREVTVYFSKLQRHKQLHKYK